MWCHLRNWNERRLLRRCAVDSPTWSRVVAAEPVLQCLNHQELIELRRLATLLLATKRFVTPGGESITTYQRTRIAAAAALPVLALGRRWHRDWQTIILYPDTFAVAYADTDEAGVVHEGIEPRAGEAWPGGPIILSWTDIIDSGGADGFHVVIHEIAHQLDGLDGVTNGRPPLHADMDAGQWSQAFSGCFDDLQARYAAGEPTALDPYATESPAECFAVTSEAFFLTPFVLAGAYPGVYEQLRLFYRQDPAVRRSNRGDA
jgi:Mlc titration factor MtfA (ptsG expression regulator)